MSDDTLRRLLGTLDEAADPSPQFRESLYATLEGHISFGTPTGGRLPTFGGRRAPMRMVWVLIVLALGLALAFGAAFVALQQTPPVRLLGDVEPSTQPSARPSAQASTPPTPQPSPQLSACETGDFNLVLRALAAASAYDYTIAGSIDLAADIGGQFERRPLNIDGHYRSPDRIEINFAPETTGVNYWGQFTILKSLRWIGSTGYGVGFDFPRQTEAPHWFQFEEPWLQSTRFPDFLSKPPVDPISFQLAGSRATLDSVTWTRSRLPDPVGGRCVFDATIRPAGKGVQTLSVSVDTANRPTEVNETRAGFRSIDGGDRNQELTTSITYPVSPTPVEAPTEQDLGPERTLPPNFTPPPILPRSPAIINVGDTALLRNATGIATQEISALELRELKSGEDGRDAPPGFVFMQLHLSIHALVVLPTPGLQNDFISQSGHFSSGTFETFMKGGPQPGLGPRLEISAGETIDGWTSALVPENGDVRYRVIDMNGQNEYLSIPLLEIVLRP